MDNDLNQAFQLVSQHNNQQIKEGQAKLNHLKKNSYYPLGLLMYMNNNQNLQPQLRAAIELKLWAQSYLNLEEFQRKFYSDVIQEVKTKIVLAYLCFDKKISQTLRPAIVMLSRSQFPRNWEQLMAGLVSYAGQNTNSIHSVLLLIQDITHKYTTNTRSDPLFEQIILVCDQVHDFILDLTVKIIQSESMDPSTLQILQTIMNVFYNLNYQDLHPKFEDNLNNWMTILKQVMNFNNINENVFKCKGAALQSILLYANKYKQDVQDSIKGFSQQIWDLCSNAKDDVEYDSIVFNCLKYFKSIIVWSQMKQFFTDNMDQLIQKLIIPNLRIKKSILEMFDEQPETFFDCYFRNNDIQSRRAASLDLLRVICRTYPNFQSYVIEKIKAFTGNMANASLTQKCNILNFIIDAATKSFRDVDGCTETFISVDIIVQCYQHIVFNDLARIYNWITANQEAFIEQQISNAQLITLMRFCYFFRIFIDSKNYQVIIKFCAQINTNHNSIKTLLYMVINAFLTIRHGDFMHYRDFKNHFNSNNTSAIATDVLQTIYKNDKSSNQLNQNLTRMLYTLTRILGQKCTDFYEYFDVLFSQMLTKTQQYHFKSVLFLFQAIGAVALWVSKQNQENNKQRLQNQIFEYLAITIKRKSDLLNFCLQILAIFLEFENKKADKHQQIYNSILNLQNWTQQNMSIMSSYIQYISAFLSRSSGNLISDKDKFEVILSRLIELEHYDLFFRFLESILKITKLDQFYDSGYFKLSIMGTQVVIQKSIMGKKIAVLFIFKLMNNYDLQKVLQYMNNVSPNLFENMIKSSDDLIRSMQSRKDRKQMFGALCQVIMRGILPSQIEGSLLSLLIQNSSNKFNSINIRQTMQAKNQRQKKQSTYQKLQIFSQIEGKEVLAQFDEQEELIKTYKLCRNDNRSSLQVLSEKNHERINRLTDKHSPSTNSNSNSNMFSGNRGMGRRY